MEHVGLPVQSALHDQQASPRLKAFQDPTIQEEFTQEKYARLRETVQKKGKGARWLVLTHDNPDPDAFASALLLGRVIRTAFKQNVTLAYGGIVGRARTGRCSAPLRLPLSHPRPLLQEP